MKEATDALQVRHLAFFQAILTFLQAFHAGEEGQKQALADLEAAAEQFKKELPKPHVRGEVDIENDMEKMLGFARGYYPELEGSESFRESVEVLSRHLNEAFGLSPL